MMKGYTEITLKTVYQPDDEFNTDVTIRANRPDYDIYEFMDIVIKPALLATGFQPKTISDYFGD